MQRLGESATGLIARPALLVGGEQVAGAGDAIVSLDPFTERVIAELPGATPGQVDAAIAAARRSFDDGVWRDLPATQRRTVLLRLADLIEEHAAALAQIIVTEAGCPMALARDMQVALPIVHLRWLADKAVTGPMGGWEQELPVHWWTKTGGLVAYEPIGVVAALAPYNVPYIAYVWKVCAALATGCSAILAPSPRTPLTAVAFMRLVEMAGVPAEVVNLVYGGPEVGKRLTESADVDMVTFTGSNAVGAQVMAQAAPTAKRVLLELGGKSPNIVLPGVDPARVAGPSLNRLFRNAGQGCGVTSRTLVPRDRLGAYEAAAREAMAAIKVGDPWREETWVGPLIRTEHRARVEGFVERALAAGGRIVAGGGRPADQARGYFMNPVLVGGLGNDSEIAQSELFGPVGVLIGYDDIDEAVALANGTRYGLNANIWGEREAALALARRLHSGNVTIDGGGQLRPDVPFGGFKQSGNGGEMGEEGFRAFLELKHISWLA